LLVFVRSAFIQVLIFWFARLKLSHKLVTKAPASHSCKDCTRYSTFCHSPVSCSHTTVSFTGQIPPDPKATSRSRARDGHIRMAVEGSCCFAVEHQQAVTLTSELPWMDQLRATRVYRGLLLTAAKPWSLVHGDRRRSVCCKKAALFLLSHLCEGEQNIAPTSSAFRN